MESEKADWWIDMSERVKVLVVAESFVVARRWAAQHSVPFADVVFPSVTRGMHGWSPDVFSRVVYARGWDEHPQADDVMAWVHLWMESIDTEIIDDGLSQEIARSDP